MSSLVLVLDNGSYNIKAGLSTAENPLSIHNALAKARDGAIYPGNDYISHPNLYLGINFKRPHEQGHLTSWETQKPLWDYTLDKLLPDLEIEPSETCLLLTESPFQLPQLSMNTDLIVFEEYGFFEYYRCLLLLLVPWAEPGGDPADFTLVVDCGFNATHVTPILYQRPYWRGVKKLPLGGRHLNSLLRELISFRHYDISDEPILINTIKEKTMYIAMDFEEELKKKSQKGCEFVLPDFKSTFTGYVKTASSAVAEDAQTIALYDERFVVPELLFHPEIAFDHNALSNNAVVQNANFKNLTDLVVDSIMACPEVIRPMLSANISVVGGTAQLPNFEARLLAELRKELPVNWKVGAKKQVHNLVDVAWHGGKAFSQNEIFSEVVISKQDYFEHGTNWCQKQFGFRNF